MRVIQGVRRVMLGVTVALVVIAAPGGSRAQAQGWACNPPCGAGQVCTSNGLCVVDLPGPPPRAGYYAPPPGIAPAAPPPGGTSPGAAPTPAGYAPPAATATAPPPAAPPPPVTAPPLLYQQQPGGGQPPYQPPYQPPSGTLGYGYAAPSPGWASGAAAFGYVSSAAILGLTIASMSKNSDDEGDQARNLGIGATIYATLAVPIVAMGGSSARNHPQVTGSPGLRLWSWIGYGLAIVDACATIAISYDEKISNEHIFSIGFLASISTLGLAIDASNSASQAESLRMQMGWRAALLRAQPAVAIATGHDGRPLALPAWRLRF